MRFSILSLSILFMLTVATPTASAQFDIAAQVSERMQSVIEAFTGSEKADRAEQVKDQARQRIQEARERRERANERSRSPQRTVPAEASRGSARDARSNGATSTRSDRDERGSRVQRAFQRATRSATSSDRSAALERLRETREQKRADVREKVDEIHRERIHAFAERMFDRLQAAINRLSQLADRIDSRIQKFNEAGVDTTDAENALADARADIEAAQTHLDEAASVFTDIREGEIDPRDIFTDVKTLIKETTGLIKNAHASLVNVIRTLKGTLDAEIDEAQDESDEDSEEEEEKEDEDTEQATSTDSTDE